MTKITQAKIQSIRANIIKGDDQRLIDIVNELTSTEFVEFVELANLIAQAEDAL